jgi:hypothetical protein
MGIGPIIKSLCLPLRLEALESAYMYPLISFSPSALTRPKIGQSADLGGGNPTLDRVSVLYFPFRVLTSSETIRCFSSERAHQIPWKKSPQSRLVGHLGIKQTLTLGDYAHPPQPLRPPSGHGIDLSLRRNQLPHGSGALSTVGSVPEPIPSPPEKLHNLG